MCERFCQAELKTFDANFTNYHELGGGNSDFFNLCEFVKSVSKSTKTKTDAGVKNLPPANESMREQAFFKVFRRHSNVFPAPTMFGWALINLKKPFPKLWTARPELLNSFLKVRKGFLKVKKALPKVSAPFQIFRTGFLIMGIADTNLGNSGETFREPFKMSFAGKLILGTTGSIFKNAAR